MKTIGILLAGFAFCCTFISVACVLVGARAQRRQGRDAVPPNGPDELCDITPADQEDE